MNPSIYIQRRKILLEHIQHGIAIIPTAPEVTRNADSHYEYRHDSNFYYLSGFTEPEAVLVLITDQGKSKTPFSILFCREKNLEREIWDGHRVGPDAAVAQLGFGAAYPIAQLDEKLIELMANQPVLFYPVGNSVWDKRILGLRSIVQGKSRIGISAPAEIQDVRTKLNEMRLFKDMHELDIMRRAASISSKAHSRAMRFTRPGQFEYQVEAELLHDFCSQGARHPAYTSIVAAGANACVLHYIANDAKLHEGDLLLIDAGCELEGYASDITRTFPVNGKFSPAQKDVYEIVLAAQQAAIDAAKPKQTWNAPHDAALHVLAQGFLELKLCHGSVDEVLETECYKQFYMHRTGHWLGMDVHDVGDYKLANQWRALQPGMVLTVEPGCYIRPADNVPRELWNIGVRIEDDVVITKVGNEVLTAAAPKTVADIEKLMQR